MSRGVDLPSSRLGYQYHRQWFADTQVRVANGEPFALIAAEAPLEILRAMDIPFVTVQWWSSIVSAKRKAPEYFDALRARGLPDDQDQYFSLGLASAFETDPANAPWGGLPRPDIIIGDPRDDNQLKIYELWAEAYGCDLFTFERATQQGGPAEWWKYGPRDWDRLIEAPILDLHVAQTRELISRLEALTGRKLDLDRLQEVLDLVNETEEWFRAARDLVSGTRPAPIGVSDTFTSVMMPQWHRGTAWARDAAKMFYDEIAARVDAGLAAYPDERLRLAWLGQGLWFNVDFYERFMASHGAVFVWSMYLGYAADAYLRYGEDPLRTLSARYAVFTQYMSMEPWPSGWFAKEAKLAGIDGAIVLGTAWPFLDDAFEKAGVPLLRLHVHQVDNRKWDEAGVRNQVGTFLDQISRPDRD
ncbi:MAG TPA: 2-hydroxyacyl-CoA dehydratase family protein [Sphingomonadaceae bacterium]|nr:2-hydroxyacyl-CoA dehydratase family protein [Sphingomonadaceae bacterium]